MTTTVQMIGANTAEKDQIKGVITTALTSHGFSVYPAAVDTLTITSNPAPAAAEDKSAGYNEGPGLSESPSTGGGE